MSLLKKIFGVRSMDEERAEAERLFSAEDFGAAKLAYDRAVDKAKDAPEEMQKVLRGRIDACRDGIAEQRMALAEQYAAENQMDLCRAEIEGAIDTAASPDVVERARRLGDSLERRDAVTQAGEVLELSDEERLSVLSGAWEEDQADEYAEYGEPFTEALLAMHDDRVKEARASLEALIEDAEDPRYLWLEVGRARLLDEDVEQGTAALRAFLDALDEDEGGEARIIAHLELARLADERDDFEAAVAELETAVTAMDEDPRPYLALGAYLRTKGHPTEAVEVLEAAIPVMGDSRPDYRVLQELGLAQRDAGDEDGAIETLEGVVDMLLARFHRDLPPETAVPLAELHEKHGRLERAADLYRTLTQGSDREHHPHYYGEAARILVELGLVDEARRMLQRASALCEDDEEPHADFEARIAALDAG